MKHVISKYKSINGKTFYCAEKGDYEKCSRKLREIKKWVGQWKGKGYKIISEKTRRGYA